MLRRPAVALRLWLFVAAVWLVSRADTQRSAGTIAIVEAANTPAASASDPVASDAPVDDPVPGFLDLFLPGLNSSESHAQDLGWHRARGSTSSTIRPCWLGDVFPGRIMQLELWAESHYATPVWLDPGELETLLLLRADNPFDVLSLLMHDELGSPTVSDPVAINDAAVRAYRKRNHMFTITLQHHQRLQPHQKRHIGVLTIRIPPPTARRVYTPNASPPPLSYMAALRYDWLLSMEQRVTALNVQLSQKETVHRDPVTRMPMVPLSVVPANILQVLFPYVSPLFVGALHLPKEDIAMLNQSVHLWQQFVNPRQARPEQFIRPASSSVLFNQTLTLTPRNLHYSEHSAAAPLRLNPSRLHFFGNYIPRPHIVSGWYDESAVAGAARVSLTAPTVSPPPMSPGDSPHIVDFGMVELGNYKELVLHFSHPFHFEVHELVQEGNVRRARPRSERNRDKLGDNIHAERDPAQSPIVLEALEVTLEYSHEELQPLPPFPLRSTDPSVLREIQSKRPASAGKPIKVLAKHNPFTFELLQTPEYKAVESSDLIKFARIIPFEKRNVSSANAQRKATPPIPYTLYRLIFSPTAAGAFESVFVVRNNLTCVEMIVLRGWSARGSMTFRRTRFPILKEYNDAAMELIRQQELDPSRPLPPIGNHQFHPDLVASAASAITASSTPGVAAAADSKASAFPWRAYGQRFMDEAPGLEIGVVVGNKATAPPLEALYNDPSAHLLFHTSSSGASGLSPPSPYSDVAHGVQSGGGSSFPRLVLDLVEYCRFFYNIANEIELDHMIHLSADRQELLLNEDIKPSRFDRWEPDLLTRVVWENSASPVEPFGVQNDGPLGFYLVAVSVGPAVSLSQSRTRAHIPRRAPMAKSTPGTAPRGPNTQGSNAGTTGGGVRYGSPDVLLNGGKYALPLKHLNLCDRFNSIPSPHHFAFNGCSQLPIYFPPGHHQWFFLSYPMLAILVPEVMAQWVATHPREHPHVLYLHLHTTTGIFSLPLELQLPSFLSSRLLLPWDEGADLIARSTVNEKARAEAMVKVLAGGASNTAAPVSASSAPGRPSIAAAAVAGAGGSSFLRLLSHLLSILVYAVACILSLLMFNYVLKYRGGGRSLSSGLSRLSRSGLQALQLWRKNLGQMLERRSAASSVTIDSTDEDDAEDEVVQIAPVATAAAAATTPASGSASKSTPKKGKKAKNAHGNHANSSASAPSAAAAVVADAAADDETADADAAAAAPADSPVAAVDDVAHDAVESNPSSNAKKEKKKKKKNAAQAAADATPSAAAGATNKSQGSPSASIDPETLSPLSRGRALKDSSNAVVGRKTPLPLVFPHMLPASPEVHVHRKPSEEDIAHAAKTRPVAAHSEAAIRLLTFGSQSHAKENHPDANGEDERKQRETVPNGKKGGHKNGQHAAPVSLPPPPSVKDDVSSTSSSVTSSAATTSTSSPVNTPVPQASPAAAVEDDVWPVALNTGKKTKSAPATVAASAAAVSAMDRTAATPPDPSPTVSPGASTRGSPRTVESYGAVAAGRNTAKAVRMHAALANLSNTAPRTVSAALQTSADKRNAAVQPKPAAAPVTVAAVPAPVVAPIVKPSPTPIASPPRKHSAHQQPQPPAPQPMANSPQRVLPPASPSRAQPHLVAPLAIAPIVNRPPENAQQLALQQTLLMVQQQQQRAAQEALRQQQERSYSQQRPMQQSYPRQHQQQQHFVSFQPSRPFLNSSAPVDSYHVGSPSSSFDSRGHMSGVAAPPSNLASVFHRGSGAGGAGSSSNSPPVSSRPHAFSDPEINFGHLQQQLQHGPQQPQQQQQHHGAFELGNPARGAYEHSSSYDHSLFHSPPSNQLHSTHPPHPQSQLRYDASSFGPSSSSSQDLPPSLFSFMHAGSASAVSSTGHSAFGGVSQQQPSSHSMYSSSLHSPQPLHPHPHPPAARAASASPVAPSSSYLHHSFFGGLGGLAQESLRRDLSYDDEESAEDLRMLATLNQPSTQSHTRRLVSYDSNSPLVSSHQSSALMYPLSPPTNSLLATPPLVPSFLMNPTQDDK